VHLRYVEDLWAGEHCAIVLALCQEQEGVGGI
jgi:hypothetical protein